MIGGNGLHCHASGGMFIVSMYARPFGTKRSLLVEVKDRERIELPLAALAELSAKMAKMAGIFVCPNSIMQLLDHHFPRQIVAGVELLAVVIGGR